MESGTRLYLAGSLIIFRRVDMDFKTELEEILQRYVPVTGDKDHYNSTIKLLSIRISDLHERYVSKEGDRNV